MSKSSQPSTISPITMVTIPQEEWPSLNDKLDRLAERIENRNATDRDAEWLESEAARKQLGVSPKTLQNHRDHRVIPFSPISRRIYVNPVDLEPSSTDSGSKANNPMHPRALCSWMPIGPVLK